MAGIPPPNQRTGSTNNYDAIKIRLDYVEDDLRIAQKDIWDLQRKLDEIARDAVTRDNTRTDKENKRLWSGVGLLIGTVLVLTGLLWNRIETILRSYPGDGSP